MTVTLLFIPFLCAPACDAPSLPVWEAAESIAPTESIMWDTSGVEVVEVEPDERA
jgi:hypothetical protein